MTVVVDSEMSDNPWCPGGGREGGKKEEGEAGRERREKMRRREGGSKESGEKSRKQRKEGRINKQVQEYTHLLSTHSLHLHWQ